MARWVPAALVLCAFHGSGCVFAVKQRVTLEGDGRVHGAARDLRHVPITVQSEDAVAASALRGALAHRLRVPDVRDAPQPAGEPDGRVSIRVTVAKEVPGWSNAWTFVSMLTLSVVPSLLHQNYVAAYVVRTAGGEERIFEYRYTVDDYNWLPLVLFRPDEYCLLVFCDERGERWRDLMDEVSARFVSDSADLIGSEAFGASASR